MQYQFIKKVSLLHKNISVVGNEEEEKRLFYVAVTRAKEKLFLSYPKTRNKFNEILRKNISPFYKEIPEDLITDLNNSKTEDGSNENMFSNLFKKWNKM